VTYIRLQNDLSQGVVKALSFMLQTTVILNTRCAQSRTNIKCSAKHAFEMWLLHRGVDGLPGLGPKEQTCS